MREISFLPVLLAVHHRKEVVAAQHILPDLLATTGQDQFPVLYTAVIASRAVPTRGETDDKGR